MNYKNTQLLRKTFFVSAIAGWVFSGIVLVGWGSSELKKQE